MSSWLILVLAGLAEIGWPIGIKLTEQPAWRVWGWVLAVGFMTISGVLLWIAQRTIPIGTAYVVWTGIGAVGTFLIGIAAFGDSVTVARIIGVTCILAGVIVLKIAH